jgi:drug/metabolite transporter (DMT)-like permease
MEYYALIMLSVAMFGGGFALQDVYRKKRGSGLKISMESALIGALAGLVVLLIVNGFSFEITGFTLLMAFLSAVNGIAFTFCAFKSLDYINLSLFSLFSMLGGMALPFFQGIIFYNEGITLAKCLCVAFICAALALTVEKGDKKKGAIFYIGIFVLNGMGGVLSKIFTASTLPKVSAAGYSIWIALCTVVLSGIAWAILAWADKRKTIQSEELEIKPTKKLIWQSYGVGALYGAINKIANFFLVIALAHVDASVQYPMVTGGTMIVSTIICFFGEKKPSKKEMISVLLAFIGMLLLFLIPV